MEQPQLTWIVDLTWEIADNESFRIWITDTVFRLMSDRPAA